MKKRISLIFLSILLLFTLTIPGPIVFADLHRLDDLDIEVYIFEDGSARIRERRRANLIEGTENYIIINNLGGSQIKDFTVREGDLVFQYIENWDIDKSREEKKYKNGIIETRNGYELAWGIGDYGSHDYQLEYTITNFIKEFQDKQGIFWRFVNDETNIPPNNVTLVLDGDHKFSSDNSKIWAFGFEGNINFQEDKIVARNTRSFDSSNHLTILIELEKGMYRTNAIIDKSFDEVRDEAFEGSSYGGEEKGSFSPWMVLVPLLIIFIPLLVLFGLIIFKVSSGGRKKYKEEYYRDYPYQGDFQDIYYILERKGLANMENLLTAFILKWINEGKIAPEDVEVGRIFKKEERGLRFIEKYLEGSEEEVELFEYMLEAAGSNEILESNEFTKWARKNYKAITKWQEGVRDKSIERLKDSGHVITEDKKILFIPYKENTVTEKGLELEANIYRFMNYLEDYSLLNEHSAINVKIWDNLMIWAGLLGITKAVEKEFKKLYPAYETESVYRGQGIYLATMFSSNASSAISSSGGGGSSSIGGGGGSFGGGSGGGTR